VKFGLALDFATAERTMEQQLDRYVELIKIAERYGFDSVTAGETYPTQPGSGHVPSPLLVLAALASRTRLRLGTGVTLLPSWHPLKLAYDSAMLDQITGGRFILGVGVSTAALQRRFGVDTERVGDFVDDTLAALRALWAGADGFEGKYLKIQGAVGIRPVQAGGPQLIVGGTLNF
jgi:alkanesulfonate monooxygenase SsuD/methylene tetrahydromethanopterin reductase-like flavin-dependent oxidoreductase (luciferase family)